MQSSGLFGDLQSVTTFVRINSSNGERFQNLIVPKRQLKL